MAEEKKVLVLIPADELNEWEKTKIFTINGVSYSIPVDTETAVPEHVALVVKEWQANIRAEKEARKAREAEMKKM